MCSECKKHGPPRRPTFADRGRVILGGTTQELGQERVDMYMKHVEGTCFNGMTTYNSRRIFKDD